MNKLKVVMKKAEKAVVKGVEEGEGIEAVRVLDRKVKGEIEVVKFLCPHLITRAANIFGDSLAITPMISPPALEPIPHNIEGDVYSLLIRYCAQEV